MLNKNDVKMYKTVSGTVKKHSKIQTLLELKKTIIT